MIRVQDFCFQKYNIHINSNSGFENSLSRTTLVIAKNKQKKIIEEFWGSLCNIQTRSLESNLPNMVMSGKFEM